MINELIKKKHDLIRSLENKEITQKVFDSDIIGIENAIAAETEKNINNTIIKNEVKMMDNDKGDYVSDDIGVLFKTLENNIINKVKELLNQNPSTPRVQKKIETVVEEKKEEIVKTKDDRTPRERSRLRLLIKALQNNQFNTKELVVSEVMKERPEDTKKQISDQLSGIISMVKSKNPNFKQYTWDEEKYLLKEK